MKNTDNNPQEVPQVKSVEDHFKYNDPHVYELLAEAGLLSTVLSMLNKQQSRIEELEAALLTVRDRHIKNPITYNIITKALSNEA